MERARQTAKIVAQALQLEDRLEEFEQLGPDRSVRDLLSGLAAYAGKEQILLVGHEPLLSSTVSFLLSEKAGAQIQLKKGGLCCLEVDAIAPRKSAVLQWALAPKHLRLLARLNQPGRIGTVLAGVKRKRSWKERVIQPRLERPGWRAQPAAGACGDADA